MSDSENLETLNFKEREHVEAIASRFEYSWQTAPGLESAPDLTEFLPPAGNLQRPAILQVLIKIDLETRWRKGQPYALEKYLDRFPELGGSDEVPTQLLYEEYRIRQQFGDQPAPELYQGRFPARYQQFQDLLKEFPLPTRRFPPSTPVDEKAETKSAPGAGLGVHKDPGMVDFLEGYTPKRRIGSGGYGEVYEAEAAGGVPVAVKMLFRSMEDEESKRELETLEIIKTLRHPFLLSTHLFRVWNNRLYIVMELADQSLHDRLKECRKAGGTGIPPEELLTYFREAADAIDYLHARKVLHRDIKPDNLLTLQQHTKLADFGLARLQQTDRSMKASGSGTPAYMPPEVWSGKVAPASDQYSLALTYAELRLDRRLFANKDMMQLMLDHLQKMPNLDPLPRSEQQVLLRAMAKNHAKRFPSCKDFIQALQAVLSLEPVVKEKPVSSPAPASDPATEELPMRPAPVKPPVGAKPGGYYGPGGMPRVGPRRPRRTVNPNASVDELLRGPDAPKPDVPSPEADSDTQELEKYGLTPWTDDRAAAVEPSKPKPATENALRLERDRATQPMPLYQTEIPEDAPRSEPKGKCPCCGSIHFGKSGVGWCSECGYTAVESLNPHLDPQAFLANRDRPKPVSKAWMLTLVIGIIAIAGGTIATCQIIPIGTQDWHLWVMVQSAGGLICALLSYVWTYNIIRKQDNIMLPLFLTPFRFVRLTLSMTGQTRYPICMGIWGLVTLGSIAYLARKDTFWWDRKPLRIFNVSQAEIAMKLAKSHGSKSRACVVIGYLGTNDTITGLLLAEPNGDRWKHVGVVKSISDSLNNEGMAFKVMRLTRNEPAIPIKGISANWVEPEIHCTVAYKSRDKDGMLQDGVIIAWGKK